MINAMLVCRNSFAKAKLKYTLNFVYLCDMGLFALLISNSFLSNHFCYINIVPFNIF